MLSHIDDIDTLGQRDTGVGDHGGNLDRGPVGVIKEGVGQSGLPPSCSLFRSARLLDNGIREGRELEMVVETDKVC